EVNATGTLNVLEAARRQGTHVVLASSSSVYGADPTLPKHERLAPAPRSPYAASKLAAESYARAYQDVYRLPAIVFRFFNLYRPPERPGDVRDSQADAGTLLRLFPQARQQPLPRGLASTLDWFLDTGGRQQ